MPRVYGFKGFRVLGFRSPNFQEYTLNQSIKAPRNQGPFLISGVLDSLCKSEAYALCPMNTQALDASTSAMVFFTTVLHNRTIIVAGVFLRFLLWYC